MNQNPPDPESDPKPEPAGEAVCPRCGAPMAGAAVDGLCPKCLGALNLSTRTEFT
ncbi:MAG: hypothetical protein H7A52_17415, partial [Akkermansiaceae bacterium]|nr:hypothetical protein [Akkermansiaceae bacterium]